MVVYICCSLVALIPLCENMPSSTAIKPGDIVTAMNGKTIEVCQCVSVSVHLTAISVHVYVKCEHVYHCTCAFLM